MKEKFVIAGNWKMNKTVSESIAFVEGLNILLSIKKDSSRFKKIKIILFPPFTSLYSLKGKSPYISIGSQNMFYEEKGAFTGEISSRMVKEVAGYVLIGHSERREIFGEKDSDINRKLKTAFDFGLTPMLCIGETLKERESGKTFEKIEKQLKEDLNGISPEKLKGLYIAYEPIWAIGTGRNATPDIAEKVHAFIKMQMEIILHSKYDLPILYGGSAKPDNCKDLLNEKDINGLLIGGASLKADTFFDIIENSIELVE